MASLKRRKISNSDKFFLLMIHDHKCANCKSEKDLEVDHIKPIARGGDDTLDNMQILCAKCNTRKKDSHDGVFTYDETKFENGFADVMLLFFEGKKQEAEVLLHKIMRDKAVK